MDSTDIWEVLNNGKSWDDFEKTENWWDDEDEIDWDRDILSGKKIQKTEEKHINVVDTSKNDEFVILKVCPKNLRLLMQENRAKILTSNEKVDPKKVSNLVKKTNKTLKKMQGSLGIKTSIIDSLISTENSATVMMKNLKKDLKIDENLKEFMRFLELTASSQSYNDTEFEKFWSEVAKKADFSLLTLRVMGNVAGLAKEFKDEGKPDYLIDSLWSDNLIHEFTTLTE